MNSRLYGGMKAGPIPEWFSSTEIQVARAFLSGRPVGLLTSKYGRTVSAPALAWLLTTEVDTKLDNERRYFRLADARVTGKLDLSGTKIESIVHFVGCKFADAIDLSYASIRSIHFQDVQVPGILAVDVLAAGSFEVLGNTVCRGSVNLQDANISGSVLLNGIRVECFGETAVELGRARISGRFAASDATIEGKVRAVSAHVGGTLTMRRTVVDNRGGISFQGERLRVDESVFVHKSVFKGRFSLLNSEIGGGFQSIDARFENPTDVCVSLTRAKIGRNFSGEKATFIGKVQLTSAIFGNNVALNSSVFDADAELDLGLIKARRVRMRFAKEPRCVDLTYSDVEVLQDDQQHWPEIIKLDGCQYRNLDPAQTVATSDRIEWLTRTEDDFYIPGPYSVLARTYENQGDDVAARAVRVSQQRKRRGTLNLAGRIAGHFFDWTVGYGYRNWYAAVWLGLAVAMGTLLFSLYPAQAIQTDQLAKFNPFLYTVDQLLPIIDLGQKRYFIARGSMAWLAPLLVVVGWSLTTAVVAGFTRFLGRK